MDQLLHPTPPKPSKPTPPKEPKPKEPIEPPKTPSRVDPVFNIIGSKSTKTYLTFNRMGYSTNVISSASKTTLHPQDFETDYIVIVSDHLAMVRPRFVSLFSKTLESMPPNSTAKHDFGHGAWVILSTAPLNIPDDLNKKHLPFAKSSFLSTIGDPTTVNHGGPFAPLHYSHDVIYQAEIDDRQNLKPIKVFYEDELYGSQVYEIDRTAYVFIHLGESDTKPCNFKLLTANFLGYVVQSVFQIRKYSQRRIILLVEDQCQDGFHSLLNDKYNLDVEVIGFKKKVKWPGAYIFRGATYFRAPYVAKCYYLMKINDFLPKEKPIDRFIFLDFDLFIQKSFDHLFDINVPKESVLGTHDVNLNIPFNTGLIVSSPIFDDFVDWSMNKLPAMAGFHYFRKNRNWLTHGEQESMMAYFRLKEQFYFIPSEYNEAFSVVHFASQHGDLNSEKYYSIHSCWSKYWRVEKSSPSGLNTYKKYIPEFPKFRKEVEEMSFHNK
ncbi:hypothetical protein GEMRC1_006924 [Eukaryota sp. GEM-RC1]